MPATNSPSSAAIGVCAMLLLLVGLSQRIVLCTHLDGDTHVEFAHDEGDCCRDPLALPLLPHACGHGHGELAPHASCSHVDLAIEITPAPRPDPVFRPDPNTPIASCVVLPPGLGPHRQPEAHSPATGPPRPRPFLSQRRSTLLLL